MSFETIEEAVAAAAATLDADPRAEGWRDRIDVEKLDPAQPSRCPLHYAYGSFLEGELALPGWKNYYSEPEPDSYLATHAFASTAAAPAWRALLERQSS